VEYLVFKFGLSLIVSTCRIHTSLCQSVYCHYRPRNTSLCRRASRDEISTPAMVSNFPFYFKNISQRMFQFLRVRVGKYVIGVMFLFFDSSCTFAIV
jgi:hypothetical protein